MQIKIPFLAEGVESGTVVSILVREGERVKKDQTILELETNKATAPIPAPASGTITKVHVKEGEEIAVGQVIMTLSESSVAGKTPTEKETRVEKAVSREKPTAYEGRVGGSDFRYESKSGLPPPASPSIRKMARDLGIDLTKVRGTERGGRITVQDLKSYLANLQAGIWRAGGRKVSAPLSIDFSKWGPINREPVSTVRRTIGQKMYEAWSTIPHVTQFDEADITSLLAFRKRYASDYERRGARLTLTGIALKAVVSVLKKHPKFNASLDELKRELICKNYYHLGVAVDTEHGLLVPVIRDVDQKNLLELSIELSELAEKTRARKISLEEVQGATFTISNLGSIGGAHFTPIINQPEVAILGLGRGSEKPVVREGKVKQGAMLPLCLSYDHRVIDGAEGARFIQDLVHAFEHFEEKNFVLDRMVKKASLRKEKQ
ncbi:MAG: 2-oxo acid dehydrogenase subunit E2 [Candidatus Omnitrophica bacterium]|nr:2-oxo acid dehydrogenase subunit E2 [Candidatus Omnitrophota bacterium]